jgi:hypothetical protein
MSNYSDPNYLGMVVGKVVGEVGLLGVPLGIVGLLGESFPWLGSLAPPGWDIESSVPLVFTLELGTLSGFVDDPGVEPAGTLTGG